MDDLTLQLTPIIDKAKLLIADQSNIRPIIAIAGGPGSGKSHLAKQLQAVLQQNGYIIDVIEQDNFSHHDGIITDTLPHINPHLKWKMVHEVMQQIKAGTSEINMPFRIRNAFPYSAQTPMPYTIEYRIVKFVSTDLIIFDGAHALSDHTVYDFFKYCNFGIFIDASDENMKTWRMEREMAKPIHLQRPEEIFREHLNKGMHIYNAYVLPTKKNASFILYKEGKDRYSFI